MSGRTFAYAAVVVGLAVSIWANVAHAMTTPGGAEPGAVAMAAFWPLGLFLALEVLTRTSWPAGRGLVVARLGVAVVAAVAAIVSYLHLHGLLLHYGEGMVPALLGPLAIDGLMTTGAAALLTGHAEPVTATTAASVAETARVTAEPVTVPRKAPAKAAGRRAAQRKPSDVDDLLLVGQAVAGELERAGQPLTRTSLMNGLRERGHSCGTDRARELLAQLRAA